MVVYGNRIAYIEQFVNVVNPDFCGNFLTSKLSSWKEYNFSHVCTWPAATWLYSAVLWYKLYHFCCFMRVLTTMPFTLLFPCFFMVLASTPLLGFVSHIYFIAVLPQSLTLSTCTWSKREMGIKFWSKRSACAVLGCCRWNIVFTIKVILVRAECVRCPWLLT